MGQPDEMTLTEWLFAAVRAERERAEFLRTLAAILPEGQALLGLADWIDRDIAAKRAILDLHARRLHTHTFHQVGQVTGPVELWTCATCCDDRCPTWEELGGGHRDPSLISCCQTIPLLALPYADRDGWDESWRPE